MNKDEFRQLIMKRTEHTVQVKRINDVLLGFLTDWKGSLEEAIHIGLVRPNFSVPRNFYNYLQDKYSGKDK